MIFSSFLTGTPQAEVAPATTTTTTTTSEHNSNNNSNNNKTRQRQQVAPTTTTTAGQLPEGATDRLRRLLQTSASKLAGLGSGYNVTGTTTTTTGASEAAGEQQNKSSATAAAGKPPRSQQEWQLERKYTLSEVQQHSSLDDCWMVIFDKVYNITEFVYEHPGGDFILLEYAGRDATQPFLSSRHGSSAYKMLDKYWIGILVDEELYYSNNSSYCSAYSSLSWRSTPTLEVESTGPTSTTTITSTSGPGSSGTVTNASSGCEDEEEEEEDEVISRENSLDSITLRGGLDEEHAPKPEVASQLATYTPHHPTTETTTTTTTSVCEPTSLHSRLADYQRPQQQQQRDSPMLMIEYHKSYAPRRRRPQHHFVLGAAETSDEEEFEDELDGYPVAGAQEKEEDADSDFGDEQRECNTCGGHSSSAAALVALATATRPQAIVRSWSSSTATAAATTLTTHALDELNGRPPGYHLSSRTLRWRPSAAGSSSWPDYETVTQQQQFH